MFRFNFIGLGMTLAAFAIGFVLRFITGQAGNDRMLAVTSGVLMFIADMAYRIRYKGEDGGLKPWLSPHHGGWLAFPAWIMGILFVIYGFVEL